MGLTFKHSGPCIDNICEHPEQACLGYMRACLYGGGVSKINKRFVCRTLPCHNASAGIEIGSVFNLGCPLVTWPWLRGNAKGVPLNVLYHCPLEHEAICPPAAGCQACLNPGTASYTAEQSNKKRRGWGVGDWSAGPCTSVFLRAASHSISGEVLRATTARHSEEPSIFFRESGAALIKPARCTPMCPRRLEGLSQ